MKHATTQFEHTVRAHISKKLNRKAHELRNVLKLIFFLARIEWHPKILFFRLFVSTSLKFFSNQLNCSLDNEFNHWEISFEKIFQYKMKRLFSPTTQIYTVKFIWKNCNHTGAWKSSRKHHAHNEYNGRFGQHFVSILLYSLCHRLLKSCGYDSLRTMRV